jgi:hypothetical protein
MKPNRAPLAQVGSLKPASAALPSLLSGTGGRPPRPETEALALARATLLYGSYRRDDAANAEVIIEAATAILAEYPAEVIIEATDPRTGIQAQAKFAAFPPNPGEVRQFCEALMEPRRREERRRREAEELDRWRREGEALRANAPTAEEIRNRYGIEPKSRDEHRRRVRDELERQDAKLRAQRAAAIQRANERGREIDFRLAGEEVPANPLAPSPSLRRALGAMNGTKAKDRPA